MTGPGQQSKVNFGEFGYIDMDGRGDKLTSSPLSLDTQGQGLPNSQWIYTQRMSLRCTQTPSHSLVDTQIIS
jgi:hypothetical protein